MMKKRDLLADLKVCNRATPGPWRCEWNPDYSEVYAPGVNTPSPLIIVMGHDPHDADFIVEAREGWPHAIERAIKAESLVREYEEVGFTPEEVMDVVRRFTSFLCEMTGGQMSKPNYTLEDMVAVADDYHQRICDESLQEEIERADKAEALARELVGVIDDLRRQISQCGLDEQMWEVYRTAKEVLGDD